MRGFFVFFFKGKHILVDAAANVHVWSNFPRVLQEKRRKIVKAFTATACFRDSAACSGFIFFFFNCKYFFLSGLRHG